eukprot:Sdes_comp20823_c0_seq2m17364
MFSVQLSSISLFFYCIFSISHFPFISTTPSAHSNVADIRGTVLLPSSAALSTEEKRVEFSRILIHIDGGLYRGFLKSDGSFLVSCVPSGVHHLEIHSPSYSFDAIRLEVTPESSQKKVRAFVAKNAPSFLEPSPISYPLKIEATHRFQYFEAREKFMLQSLLRNPTVLIMLFTLVMVFVLPKLTANMDPKELEEMQANSPLAKLTSNSGQSMDVASFMAKSFGGASTSASSASLKKKR